MHKNILFHARHGTLKSIYGILQFKQLCFIIGLFYIPAYFIGPDCYNIIYYEAILAIPPVLLLKLVENNILKLSAEKIWGGRLMPYACLTGTKLSFFHIIPERCAPIETFELETVQHICIKCPLLGSMKYGIDIQYRDGRVRSYEAALDVPFNLEVEDLEAALKEHGVVFTFMRKHFFRKTQLPLK